MSPSPFSFRRHDDEGRGAGRADQDRDGEQGGDDDEDEDAETDTERRLYGHATTPPDPRVCTDSVVKITPKLPSFGPCTSGSGFPNGPQPPDPGEHSRSSKFFQEFS